jgi:hypothetical protein
MSAVDLSEEDREGLRRVSARLNAHFAQLLGREPRYRYFQPKGGPMFGWYVEAPTEGNRAGRYCSFVYAPIGKGSRSGTATRWKYVQDAESWHDLRKDAKARAVRLYRAYQAGDKTPWR